MIDTDNISKVIIKNLSFHSLTGCDYKKAKSSNFASIASFLHNNSLNVMTFDANEPDIDSVNENEIVFFKTNDGTDKNATLLLGDNKVHDLKDGWREIIRKENRSFEDGYTFIIRGNKKKRYDYIFADKSWKITDFKVLYEKSLAATSDHAMLIADYEV